MGCGEKSVARRDRPRFLYRETLAPNPRRDSMPYCGAPRHQSKDLESLILTRGISLSLSVSPHIAMIHNTGMKPNRDCGSLIGYDTGGRVVSKDR